MLAMLQGMYQCHCLHFDVYLPAESVQKQHTFSWQHTQDDFSFACKISVETLALIQNMGVCTVEPWPTPVFASTALDNQQRLELAHVETCLYLLITEHRLKHECQETVKTVQLRFAAARCKTCSRRYMQTLTLLTIKQFLHNTLPTATTALQHHKGT